MILKDMLLLMVAGRLLERSFLMVLEYKSVWEVVWEAVVARIPLLTAACMHENKTIL